MTRPAPGGPAGCGGAGSGGIMADGFSAIVLSECPQFTVPRMAPWRSPSPCPVGYDAGMDPSKPCPMCGATIRTDAHRCLSCGESFAPPAPKRFLPLIHVHTAGVLPGAIAAAAAYLIYYLFCIFSGYVSSPNFEVAALEPVVGVLLSIPSGAVLGSAIAAGIRVASRIHSDRYVP